MDKPLDSEVVDIVDLLADKKRAEALDKISDYLYSKALMLLIPTSKL